MGTKTFMCMVKHIPEYWDKQNVTQIKHTGFHLQMPRHNSL